MRKCLQILFLAIACSTCAVHAGEENVLWWMFDETTDIYDIDGTSHCKINELVGRGEAQGKTVNAIRVAAYNGDGFLGYAAIADGEGGTSGFYSMPTTDLDTGTVSWNAGPTYAVIAPYASESGVMFMIELGNWDGSATAGSEWTILAHSDQATIAQLAEFIDSSDFDIHTKTEWSGGHYSVPEPSSGLLLLIGGALLALRRRSR